MLESDKVFKIFSASGKDNAITNQGFGVNMGFSVED